MIIWFGGRVVDKGKVGWVGVANKNAWFGARCMFVGGFANSIFWERTSIVCSTGPTLTGVKLAGLFIIPIQGALGNDTIGGGQAKCWKEKENFLDINTKCTWSKIFFINTKDIADFRATISAAR